MKTRQLIKALGGTLVAAVLVFSSLANADTQLIHFDDAGNGDKWYSDVDRNFLFDPTNMSSASLCADSTNGGNGSCVLEGGQDSLPRMTRPANDTLLQGDPNDAPTWVEEIYADPLVTAAGSGADLAFTLDSFYFLLNGRGEFQVNYLQVTGYRWDGSEDVQVATQIFQLGTSYGNVTFYGDKDNTAGDPAGALDWNTGYIATFGQLFADVTSIQFNALGSAQIRLDCVVATFDGTTTEPLSGFNGGCGGGTDVPEPGTLALLGIGLFGMGLMRRRRKV